MKMKRKVSAPLVLEEAIWLFGDERVELESMLQRFLVEGFSYDEMSEVPDHLTAASATALAFILPRLIDEMISRNDTASYMIFHVLTAFDPHQKNEILARRFSELNSMIDPETVRKFLALVPLIKDNLPLEAERLAKACSYWEEWLTKH